MAPEGATVTGRGVACDWHDLTMEDDKMINISPNYIRAALMHAPKKDIREYLQTVAVELVDDHIVIVATDGLTLLAVWDSLPHGQQSGTFLFDRAAVDLAMKTKPSTVEFDPTARTLKAGLATIPALGENVQYANWRAVLPAQAESGPSAAYYPQMNPALELRCMQSLAVASGRSPTEYRTVHRYTSGTADRPVQYCMPGLNAIALAMPMNYGNEAPPDLPVPPQ